MINTSLRKYSDRTQLDIV